MMRAALLLQSSALAQLAGAAAGAGSASEHPTAWHARQDIVRIKAKVASKDRGARPAESSTRSTPKTLHSDKGAQKAM